MTTGENEMDDDAHNAGEPESQQGTSNQVYDDEDETWALVVVQWRDAHQGGEGSWTLTEGYEADDCLPITVGWVWPKCKPGYLTIASTVMNHPANPEVVSDVNHIPWENIVTVYSLAVHMPVNWNAELD